VKRAERARAVARILAELYPGAECELDYHDPWQLLVATVLSAQTTDARVNAVTPELFGRWPTPAALADAPLAEVEHVIRTIGLYRNKARNIRQAARMLMAEHGGTVPGDLEALVGLPGVGRKTAKVVLGEAFGEPAGIPVDTHVRRVSRRIGLTRLEDAERIAADLEGLLPRSEWVAFSMRTILHGRRVCGARRPACDRCAVAPVCRQVGL